MSRDYAREETDIIKLVKSCIKRRDYQEAIKYLVWADTFRFIQTANNRPVITIKKGEV